MSSMMVNGIGVVVVIVERGAAFLERGRATSRRSDAVGVVDIAVDDIAGVIASLDRKEEEEKEDESTTMEIKSSSFFFVLFFFFFLSLLALRAFSLFFFFVACFWQRKKKGKTKSPCIKSPRGNRETPTPLVPSPSVCARFYRSESL